MKRKEKMQIVKDLLAKNGGKFSVEELQNAAGSERVARSAVFLSRRAGMKLEAIRDSGRKVTSYVELKTATVSESVDQPASAQEAVAA